MTKAELIALMIDVPDDADIYISSVAGDLHCILDAEYVKEQPVAPFVVLVAQEI